MRALNGRLPQNDRLDRRISHRRMTIALGMATTWQICWSRTSWQLTWCVCVRCLVGNVILVKQFCGVEARTLSSWWRPSWCLSLCATCLTNVVLRCSLFRHMNYWEPIYIYIHICLLITSWWMVWTLSMRHPHRLNGWDECFQRP